MKNTKLSALAIAAGLAMASPYSSAGVVGFLGNFDVINDTGYTAHGFEIDLEGISSSDITDTFGGPGRGFPTGRGFGAGSVERYGSPSFQDYTLGSTFGVKVIYQGLFNSTTQSWDYGTPSGNFITPGDNCWSGGGLGYSAATPCDHFGVGSSKNATKTTYSWLAETSPTSGTLNKIDVSLPAPVWQVQVAPAVAGQPPAPPVVVAAIQAPDPVQLAEVEAQWGKALWVKVFTTEVENAPKLEDLVGGNPALNNMKTETEWQLLQKDPGNPNSGILESGYGAPVGPKAASIIRRYEFYDFGGEYDAIDHHAILLGNDSNPVGSDVGHYLGAQNGAANLNIAIAAAVPEPETYAMLLAGLALIGAAVKRRKAKQA